MSIIFRWTIVIMLAFALGACRVLSETPSIAISDQPEVFYIHENDLIRHRLNQEPEILLTLPDIGEPRDALEIEDTIFILRRGGLQKVSLSDHSISLIVEFNGEVINGALWAAANDKIIVYSVDEKVGFYHIAKGTTSEVISQPGGFFVPLGLTGDGKNLYLLPLAGDPEFPEVWSVNLSNGEVTSLSTWLGSQYAALAPNGRYLVTRSVRFTSIDDPPEYGLNLYDLSSDPPAEQSLTLPNMPSHSYGLDWSPDGHWVYFLLRPGLPHDEPTISYGLWRLDVESKTFSQVAAIDNPAMHLVCISPNGEWALLRPEVEHSFALVHIPTGKIETISLPPGRIELVRWR